MATQTWRRNIPAVLQCFIEIKVATWIGNETNIWRRFLFSHLLRPSLPCIPPPPSNIFKSIRFGICFWIFPKFCDGDANLATACSFTMFYRNQNTDWNCRRDQNLVTWRRGLWNTRRQSLVSSAHKADLTRSRCCF